MMATSEKKMVKKPHRICNDCGVFVWSTAEWISHNILVHNKDHKETGDVPKSTKVAHKEHKETGAVPKSTKVNSFCRHCYDRSRAGAVPKSMKVNLFSEVGETLKVCEIWIQLLFYSVLLCGSIRSSAWRQGKIKYDLRCETTG